MLKEEIKRLKIQVAWLQKQLFGSKSERIDPAQTELFKEGFEMGKPEPLPDCDETSEREEEKSKGKKTNRRKRKTKAELFPKNLPVVEKETLIPAEVQANPEDYKKIGERYHDELDYQPARLQWQRTIIAEYVPKGDKSLSPVRESAPTCAVPKTMITPALAAALVIDKHCDHLPHFRQSARFLREQTVEISHKTINAWVHHTANHLAPIATAIAKELRHKEVLQIDETPMHYLIPGSGKAHKGYFWVMRCPLTGAVYYQWQKSRSAKALMETLGYDAKKNEITFKGVIQCDGYSCYLKVMNAYEAIQLAACLAHIRRKFIDDASLQKIDWVAYLLKAIRALYRIERRIKNTHAPPDQTKHIRQRWAKPIVTKLHDLLTKELSNYRPQSSCGRAISYALNQWEQWILYLEDGRLPIDNNGVENAIRPCKLGIKNYMFFGSLEAGHNNAVLYTLIENCKTEGLNPRDYLEHVIEALHTQQPEELTPAKIAAHFKKSEEAA